MDPAIVTELGNNITNSFQIMMKKIAPMWLELGISNDDQIRRCKTAQDHLLAEMDDIVESEDIAFKEFLADVNRKTNEVVKLTTALTLEPISVDDTMTLLEKDTYLCFKLNAFTQERKKRMEVLKQLKKTESRFCAMLCLPPHVMTSKTGVPSESDLHDLEEYLDMLMDKHYCLHLKYCSNRRELIDIMETVGMTPDTDFERQALCCEDEEFLLSEENLKKLDAFLAKARAKKLEQEKQKVTLVEKAVKLWTRLAISAEERQAFLENHNDCRESTLEKIQREIERCEEIKRKNIKSYIEVLHFELRELWVKCHISESEQRQFLDQVGDQTSESVLNIYETEVQKLNEYYKNTKGIFVKIKQRLELWDSLIDFERKAKDPQKYLNRGGNLLREEKERKKLNRDLPRLEMEIDKAIDYYENSSGKKFLFNGMNFKTFVSNQWAQHEEDLKLLKQQPNVTLREPTTANKRLSLAMPKSTPYEVMKSNRRVSISRISGVNSHVEELDAARSSRSTIKDGKNSDHITIKSRAKNTETSSGASKSKVKISNSSSSNRRLKTSEDSITGSLKNQIIICDTTNGSNSSKSQMKTSDVTNGSGSSKSQVIASGVTIGSSSSKSQMKASGVTNGSSSSNSQDKTFGDTNGSSSSKSQVKASGVINGPSSSKIQMKTSSATNGPSSSSSCRTVPITSTPSLKKGLRSSPNAASCSNFADGLCNPLLLAPKKKLI